MSNETEEKKEEVKETRPVPEFFQSILKNIPVAEAILPEKGDCFLSLPANSLLALAALIKEDEKLKFEMLECISGVDGKEEMRVVYHFLSLSKKVVLQVSITTARESPHVPTLTGIYPSANWLERETFDMYGIRFDGHPNLKRILLPEDWEGWPLRKDYVAQEEFHGISLRR